jgi:hypothetical protein
MHPTPPGHVQSSLFSALMIFVTVSFDIIVELLLMGGFVTSHRPIIVKGIP